MSKLKVYFAAPYVMKDLIKTRTEELQASGVVVTSSWVNERHAPNTQMNELTPEEHQIYAVQDVKDVKAANIIVFHTDPTKLLVRGGRHVEFGIAIGIGLSRSMPIFVVGEEHENIFHYLPQVTHFDSWEKVKTLLCALAAANQE